MLIRGPEFAGEQACLLAAELTQRSGEFGNPFQPLAIIRSQFFPVWIIWPTKPDSHLVAEKIQRLLLTHRKLAFPLSNRRVYPRRYWYTLHCISRWPYHHLAIHCATDAWIRPST